ncbi:MAG TPA: PAS domain S-box protein, partial [Gemmatimonadaceae bacterium]|nr:PAS domain S-box protein [Gemmatimonadaceae bacterium]
MTIPLRALIIEDSEDDALLLVRELRRSGYDLYFERVQTEEAVVAALDRERWDIVISDHHMPAFDGIDALRVIRERAPDLPFIFVSGTLGEDTAVAAMRAGAQDYVMKGNLKRLPPAIDRELRDAQTRRERRLAEERLHSTSELLRSVFAASPLAIVATDLDGRVQLWNPAAERLFGWTAAEVVGRANPTEPSQREGDGAALRARVVRDRASLTDIELQRQRRDGSLVDVSLSLAATYDSEGAADGITAVLQDLTARKQFEVQFLQAQKMEAVGRLAAGVAHDFNNFLTVISAYCNLLRDTFSDDDPRMEELGEIQRASKGAAALTRQLLAFSRPSAIEPRAIELRSVVSDSSGLIRRLVGDVITIDQRLDPDAGFVNADPGQIEQILMNLAVNGRDAMAEGGTLTIDVRHVDATDAGLADTGSAPHGYCMLAVTDTGTGMDEETQARVFEPFFTTKVEGQGTGLGLATVYGIVTRAGGVVRVRYHRQSRGQGRYPALRP